MTNKELILGVMREQGRADALSLRSRAPELDGTAVIAEEGKVPLFVPGKDYSGWAAGSPVAEIVDGEVQIYKWITPVNSANYPDMLPSNSPALLSPCHTTDPARAKPYVAPYGTSGLYMAGECCTENGSTYRSTQDNNPYAPSEYPDYWELASVQGGT